MPTFKSRSDSSFVGAGTAARQRFEAFRDFVDTRRGYRVAARAIVFSGLFAGFTAIAARWYWKFHNSVFAMDDPGVIIYYSDDSTTFADKTIFNVVANRWRPVTDTAYWLGTTLFGEDYTGWWTLHMALLGLLGALSTILFWRLSKRLWLALLLGVVVVLSRFSQYQATQATGLVESVGNILFVALFACLVEYVRSRRHTWLAATAIIFLFLVLTHERYQGLLLPLVAALVLYSGLRPLTRILWGLAFLVPVVLMTALKTLVLRVPLAVGPGSAHELGFSWTTARENLVLALSNVFGVNLGVSNLAGLTLERQTVTIQGVSLLLALLTVVLIVVPTWQGLGEAPHRRTSLARHGFFAASLATGLLMPVIVISRLEQRFIVTLGIFLLAGIACLAKNALTRSTLECWAFGAALLLFVALSVFMDVKYRASIDDVYFRAQQVSVEHDLPVLVSAIEASVSRDVALYVVDPYSPQDPGWNLGLNMLVEANTDLGYREMIVVSSVSAIPPEDLDAVILSLSPVGLVRI